MVSHALNLIRLDAWWNGHPLDRTRTSHLTQLDLSHRLTPIFTQLNRP
jgi:hypothetical protein